MQRNWKNVHFVSLIFIFIFIFILFSRLPRKRSLPRFCLQATIFIKYFSTANKFRFKFAFLCFSFFVISTQSRYVSICLCNLHFLSFNLNCKYTAKSHLLFISHLLAHGAVRKVNRPVSQKSLFLSFYGVLSLPKELQGDCKALGDHKTVKQAPLKIKRRREQDFHVHRCWINENEASRNIHSMKGNFSTTYQVFIS